MFPCKYAKHGCTHKLVFSPTSTHKHESTCSYKKWPCPIRSSRCKWFGRLTNLLPHCKILHPDKISPNPCVFQHVFTQPLHETYLITAFDQTFMCAIDIWQEIAVHVRLIGDEKSARFFKFTLNVFTKQSNKITEEGAVSAENSTPSPLIVGVGALSGLPAATFKLTVLEVDTTKCRYCVKSRYSAKSMRYEGACAACKQNTTFCRFHKNGCPYTDAYPEKCKKHETYFCQYLIECPDCNLNIPKRALFKHYVSNHGAFRAKNGRTFHVNEGYKQYCILVCDEQLFLCKFSLACYRLLFTVFSPFDSEQMRCYACEVRISGPPGNRCNRKLAPKFDLNSCHDWHVNVNMYNYPTWRHYGLDVCVFVRRKGCVSA